MWKDLAIDDKRCEIIKREKCLRNNLNRKYKESFNKFKNYIRVSANAVKNESLANFNATKKSGFARFLNEIYLQINKQCEKISWHC